jgi:hypothetical protein
MGVVSCLMLFERFSYGCGLPMAAAVTATTVEAATAVHCATVESTANCAASSESTTVKPTTTTVEAGPKTASAEAGTSEEAAAEPRASADEKAAREPARAVVAIRRASVGVIPVVAVGANGSRTDIPRPDADAHDNALSAGVRRQGQGRSKYPKNHQIFDEMFHFWAPSEPVKPV